jgi:hypothetical protein
VPDYSLKNAKSRAKDAFGAPLADKHVDTERPAGPGKRSFRRGWDKVARTISGREKTEW